MALYNNQQGITAGIFYKGQLAGVAGFNTLDWKNKIGTIGYWLGVHFIGKGIMTRVVCALIEYAFNNLKLNRLEIRVATNNFKSRAIPERLYFTLEGYIRQAEWLYDHYVDHRIYGMLAEEWKIVKKKLELKRE